MNKEALKSIYAYNMLFNTSSGTNDADGDVKFNTDLISDFDLQNFDAKRFEYYTTLLKTFDNDRDTLMNVLNKYNSVKSLRVKERKIIREINDYINKIRRVNGKFVGGAGVETLSEKIIDLKLKFTKFLQNVEIINKDEPALAKVMETDFYDQKKEIISPLDKLIQKFTEGLLRGSENPEFLVVFEKAYTEFNKKKNILELKKEDIDDFETSINTFEQHINDYKNSYENSKKTTGGEISSKNTEKFIEFMDQKNSDDDSTIKPILEELKELIDLAITIITLARKSVKLARKNLLDPNKEQADAAGSLKGKVIANSSGLKDLILKISKKVAKEASDNINHSVKEVDFLSKTVGIIKDEAYIHSVNADIRKEEARLELETVLDVLASLPENTRENASINAITIRKNIEKKIRNYNIRLEKSKEVLEKSKEVLEKSKEVLEKSKETLKKDEVVAVEVAVKVANNVKKYLEEIRNKETDKLVDATNDVIHAVNYARNTLDYIENAKSVDVREAVNEAKVVVENIQQQLPQQIQQLPQQIPQLPQQIPEIPLLLPQTREVEQLLPSTEEEHILEEGEIGRQKSIITTAKNYKKIPNHIPNIIKIQNAVTTAETAFRNAEVLAKRADDAYKSVEDILTKFKAIERDMKEKARKANEFSKNPTLLSAELAEKAKKEAEILIKKAKDLEVKAKAKKEYASYCAEYIYLFKNKLNEQVIIAEDNKAKAQKEAEGIAQHEAEERAKKRQDLEGLKTPRKVAKLSFNKQLTGGAKTEEKYSDDTLKAKYLEKQSYRNISPVIQQGFRDVNDLNKGKLVRIKTDNKIDQLANDIDIYNALSVEEREDNRVNITNKIKEFENDPQNPLEELEITLDDRIVFIIATFFIRYITILMVQWCVDIDIIKSFYEGFIYYAIIYIILFWFVVLFINIDNGYDVKYMNFNGIINSIRSLFYYFYMGTNGISRLLIHTSLILLLIVIPIILNIKKKPDFKDEANEETVVNTKILNYEERKQLSKTLTLFTMFIWLFTSIIATKF